MAAKPPFQPPRLGHLDVCFVYMYTASEPHAHVFGIIVVIINIILYNINNLRSYYNTVEPLLYDHPQNHIGVVV